MGVLRPKSENRVNSLATIMPEKCEGAKNNLSIFPVLRKAV